MIDTTSAPACQCVPRMTDRNAAILAHDSSGGNEFFIRWTVDGGEWRVEGGGQPRASALHSRSVTGGLALHPPLSTLHRGFRQRPAEPLCQVRMSARPVKDAPDERLAGRWVDREPLRERRRLPHIEIGQLDPTADVERRRAGVLDQIARRGDSEQTERQPVERRVLASAVEAFSSLRCLWKLIISSAVESESTGQRLAMISGTPATMKGRAMLIIPSPS